MVVFSVWEPILPTDASKPGPGVLRRLSDHRVRQFWDPDHAVAAALKAAIASGKARPNCCEDGGVLWDLGAVYPPGALWEEALPEPVFIDGTVVKAAARLEAAIANLELRQ